jgi:uncharacterized protein
MNGVLLAALFVVSLQAGSGKTTLCAGLARYFLDSGKKVGYLQPSTAVSADGDVAFMQRVLGLTPEIGSLKLTETKDIILVESMLDGSQDDVATRTAYGSVKEMNARVIAIESYTGNASGFINVYKGFGPSLLGVVLNKVPSSQLKRVQNEASAQFGASGINLLGVLPEDRLLSALTVGELAESVHGKILNNLEKSVDLVENYMLGALVVDSGVTYFERKRNKSAVLRQDRPDMQLAALETSTKCLVLCGSEQPPIYTVLHKAQSNGVPVISTELNTESVVAAIEAALAGVRFKQENKISTLAGMLKQNLNLKGILA